MTILFICGSLEPGKDGVGDYTRRIAGALLRQGFTATAIAINDRYITEEFDGHQSAEGAELAVLRLPAGMDARTRFLKAKSWVVQVNPEWISLQYVPFAFTDRGLPFGLSGMLAGICKGRRTHIMFHELWVGMDIDSPLKHKIWGWVQKLLILGLIKNLKPDVICTQTRLYQAYLVQMGFKPQYLPLITNIPFVGAGAEDKDAVARKTFTLVIFGNIHHGAPAAEFAMELAAFGLAKGLNCVLKTIGRCGNEEQLWVQEFRAEGIVVEILGERPVHEVSAVLQNADAGISTTPLAIIDKSGSVAAMQAHGLPVICVARPWYPRGISHNIVPEGVYPYQQGDFAQLANSTLNAAGNNNSAEKVSVQLINMLKRV